MSATVSGTEKNPPDHWCPSTGFWPAQYAVCCSTPLLLILAFASGYIRKHLGICLNSNLKHHCHTHNKSWHGPSLLNKYSKAQLPHWVPNSSQQSLIWVFLWMTYKFTMCYSKPAVLHASVTPALWLLWKWNMGTWTDVTIHQLSLVDVCNPPFQLLWMLWEELELGTVALWVFAGVVVTNFRWNMGEKNIPRFAYVVLNVIAFP